MSYLLLFALFLYTLKLSSRLSVLEQGSPKVAKPAFTMAVPNPVVQAPVAPAPQNALSSDLNAGQTFTVVGGIALVIGLGLFFKFAIDSGWISEWGRIMIGLLIGGMFMILGQVWKEKHDAYSTAMTGIGAAVLYLSVLLGNQLYDLYSADLTIVLLLFVSVATYYLASRHSSKYVQFESFLGAYIAPLLLYMEVDNQGVLFGYITLLNFVVLGLVVKKFSNELLALAAFLSSVNFLVWAESFSSPDNMNWSFVFLIISLLVFVIGGSYAYYKEHLSNPSEDLDNIFKIYLYFYGAFALIMSYFVFGSYSIVDYISAILLLSALIFFVGYTQLLKAGNQGINYAMSFTSAVFLLMGLMEAFRNSPSLQFTFTLLAISVISMMAAHVFRRKELLAVGIVVLFIALAKVMFFDDYYKFAVAFLNLKFFLILLTTTALFFGNWVAESCDDEELKNADRLMIDASVLTLWLGVTLELLHFSASSMTQLLVSIWTMLFGIFTLGLGGTPKWRQLRRVGFVLITFAILKVFLYDSSTLETGYRIVAFIALGSILLALAFFYQKNKDQIKEFLT